MKKKDLRNLIKKMMMEQGGDTSPVNPYKPGATSPVQRPFKPSTSPVQKPFKPSTSPAHSKPSNTNYECYGCVNGMPVGKKFNGKGCPNGWTNSYHEGMCEGIPDCTWGEDYFEDFWGSPHALNNLVCNQTDASIAESKIIEKAITEVLNEERLWVKTGCGLTQWEDHNDECIGGLEQNQCSYTTGTGGDCYSIECHTCMVGQDPGCYDNEGNQLSCGSQAELSSIPDSSTDSDDDEPTTSPVRPKFPKGKDPVGKKSNKKLNEKEGDHKACQTSDDCGDGEYCDGGLCIPIEYPRDKKTINEIKRFKKLANILKEQPENEGCFGIAQQVVSNCEVGVNYLDNPWDIEPDIYTYTELCANPSMLEPMGVPGTPFSDGSDTCACVEALDCSGSDDSVDGHDDHHCTGLESYAISLGIQPGTPGVDDTTMSAEDQYCIKCQSGSWPDDMAVMCDCCDTDYTYDDNTITYDDSDDDAPDPEGIALPDKDKAPLKDKGAKKDKKSLKEQRLQRKSQRPSGQFHDTRTPCVGNCCWYSEMPETYQDSFCNNCEPGYGDAGGVPGEFVFISPVDGERYGLENCNCCRGYQVPGSTASQINEIKRLQKLAGFKK